MKKDSKVWKGFLVAGITALTVPPVVYGQTAVGEGSSGSSSGMKSDSPSSSGTYSGSSDTKSGTSSGMTGSPGTHTGSSGTSGMTGSPETHSGSSSSMSSMNKDIASTDADKRLNSQIRQSMNIDTSLANIGQNIHFSTQDGEVTLLGSVASETEKNQIEQKVKQLSDVKSVKNELQVTSMGSSSSMGSGSQ
jgi:osmotically-inducible protein OsmY